ncbi:hypothetical protein [Corynebacterium sp. CNJ-954]|uniref:hypothetical protein n=1 Tax=Corynebacterium sp. CNJ-954 TaxID=1904962 RepID=UPI0009F9D7CA|nr:hypothetical protein [Corynebacterium sp. CNJ-954]
MMKRATAAALTISLAGATPAIASAASTHAGDRIQITGDGAFGGNCTLNSIAKQGDTLYGVTSGHCFDESELGFTATGVKDASGDVLADVDDIAAGDNYYTNNGAVDDFAYFRLNDGVEVEDYISSSPGVLPFINGFFQSPEVEVAGYKDVSDLRVGQIVTKDGAMSGRTMGMVLDVNSNSKEVTAIIPAIGGDSGGPLYVVENGKAYIVGNLTGGSPLLFNIFDGTQQHISSAGLEAF